MAFVGLRLSDRTAQMLDEMAEGSGLTRQEILRVALVVLYRLYHGQVVESLVAGDSQQSGVVTASQDTLRSQQEAQESVQEELDESQDVLEEWRSKRREEERKKREKRKKEKKKRKRR